MVQNPRRRFLQVWCAVGFLIAMGGRAEAECRSASLPLTTTDQSLDLGEYGTMFREASLPECREIVRGQLTRKLRNALAAAPRFDVVLGRSVPSFERWLAGANIGLAIPAAMQLPIDAALDQELRAAIAAYRFNIDPACGTNAANECMDDFTQAAVAYAWSAAYTKRSDLADAARSAMHEALAHDRHTWQLDEIISFNHGFQNVAYGIGLMTSISSAAIALEEAGFPFVPTEEETTVAWALFREGQKHTLADGTAFRSDCLGGSCADADYKPRMFPVRTVYERVFHSAPNEEPYRFDEADPSLFRTAFINDGRYAVYVELGERWWRLRPALDRYHPPRARAVRH
jgi:hypothetical protein